jgi:hypothetical protein
VAEAEALEVVALVAGAGLVAASPVAVDSEAADFAVVGSVAAVGDAGLV